MATEVEREFSRVVHSRRLEKGLTLKYVADRCDTHKGYVSGIEHRKVNPPSPKIVKKLAKVLGLDYIELLVLAEIEKVAEGVREIFREGALAVLDANKNDRRPALPTHPEHRRYKAGVPGGAGLESSLPV